MKAERSKRHLVCIDSDGCAIDSMTVKHEKAFGPAFAEVWQVPEGEKPAVLKDWNDINLYRITRGINRFQGLAAILEMHSKYADHMERKQLNTWIKETKALSSDALQKEYEKCGLGIMKKALAWSDRVNEIISQLPLAAPFIGVKETIARLKEQADIAVVSSANPKAIEEEWVDSGLCDFVDYFYSQADGTKTECIKKLISMGYEPSKTMMVGDAFGDYQAAKDNGVCFYPILAAGESKSWKDLRLKYAPLFLQGQFSEKVQRELLERMKENLS